MLYRHFSLISNLSFEEAFVPHFSYLLLTYVTQGTIALS